MQSNILWGEIPSKSRRKKSSIYLSRRVFKNSDMFRPENADGKIFRDLEEINSLQCLITEPTRIVEQSQTPLDVFLTNTPELFEKCGTYDPGFK